MPGLLFFLWLDQKNSVPPVVQVRNVCVRCVFVLRRPSLSFLRSRRDTRHLPGRLIHSAIRDRANDITARRFAFQQPRHVSPAFSFFHVLDCSSDSARHSPRGLASAFLFPICDPLTSAVTLLYPSLTFAVRIAFAIRRPNDTNSLTLEKPIGHARIRCVELSFLFLFFSFFFRSWCNGDAFRANVRDECQSARSYNEQLISRPLDTPLDTDRTTRSTNNRDDETRSSVVSIRFDIVSALRTRRE